MEFGGSTLSVSGLGFRAQEAVRWEFLCVEIPIGGVQEGAGNATDGTAI